MLEIMVSFFLIVGGCFTLIGSIGLARLPDFLMRLHGPTKATTLGVGGLLLASIAETLSSGAGGPKELLITLFVFVTAPVSAHMLAKAALHVRLRSRAPLPPSVDN